MSSNKSKTGNVIDFELLKRVLEFSKPYKKHFVLAGISAILLSILGPARPMIINYAIDNFIIIPDKEGLIRITILLVCILTMEGFVQFFYILCRPGLVSM